MRKMEIEYINPQTEEEAIAVGLKILRTDIFSLKKLHPSWRDNSKVMLALIKEDILAYRYASLRIRTSKNLAIQVLKKEGVLLDSVASNLREDKDVVLTAVGSYGYSLQYASEDLKNDREVVRLAVKTDPRSLVYASSSLRKDVELINLAFEKYGPFLIEPKAQLAFNKLDGIMIRSTIKIKEWSYDVDMDEHGMVKFDEEKMKRNGTYVKYKKFYDGTITAVELMEMQNELIKSFKDEQIEEDEEELDI